MMTLEQLNHHHAQIHQVLAQAINSKQTNDAGDTTALAQLEAALRSLKALRDEMAAMLAGKAKGQPMLVDTRVEYIVARMKAEG